MTISITKLNSLTAKLDVEVYPGMKMGVTYRCFALSDAVLRHIDTGAVGGMAEREESYRKALLGLLVEWELTDDKDQVLPVTEATLARLSLPVLDTILSAILRDPSPQLVKKTQAK